MGSSRALIPVVVTELLDSLLEQSSEVWGFSFFKGNVCTRSERNTFVIADFVTASSSAQLVSGGSRGACSPWGCPAPCGELLATSPPWAPPKTQQRKPKSFFSSPLFNSHGGLDEANELCITAPLLSPAHLH